MQGNRRIFGVKKAANRGDLRAILPPIRKKDSLGFELLYTRYYRFLFNTAYLLLQQESDAMDAVQNAALRFTLWRRDFFLPLNASAACVSILFGDSSSGAA